jgi:tight adherence protein C
MRDELPTVIDLLNLCLLAGESVPAALARVASALGGPLGSELGRTVSDIRAGASVTDSLEELCDRIPEPTVDRFIAALCTAIERGTPLAETLTGQADDIREAKRRELIERAGRREVLMLIPVVFLILPVIVAFALLPGLVALDLLVP